jgi:hypothetical protein
VRIGVGPREQRRERLQAIGDPRVVHRRECPRATDRSDRYPTAAPATRIPERGLERISDSIAAAGAGRAK